MLDHRVQISLDTDRYERVTRLARDSGVSVAAMVREAIDRGLPDPMARRSDAVRQILAAAPMPVPEDPAELRAERDESRYRIA